MLLSPCQMEAGEAVPLHFRGLVKAGHRDCMSDQPDVVARVGGVCENDCPMSQQTGWSEKSLY